MGNKLVYTSRIDELASEGIIYSNTYVTSSVCAPGRNTLLIMEELLVKYLESFPGRPMMN